MTVSATEVGRFVEEAHVWTSKDLPRDVARFWTTQSGVEGEKRWRLAGFAEAQQL